MFSPITHDGNVQQSPEEVERVRATYNELLGREYTASDKSTRPLVLADFLFIAPYNAQVRSIQAVLPAAIGWEALTSFKVKKPLYAFFRFAPASVSMDRGASLLF